jgi:hypothetical protein
MSTNLRYMGLDVHTETIAVAVAETNGEVRSLGVIPNRPDPVAKLIRKLGSREQLRVCYEAPGLQDEMIVWETRTTTLVLGRSNLVAGGFEIAVTLRDPRLAP